LWTETLFEVAVEAKRFELMIKSCIISTARRYTRVTHIARLFFFFYNLPPRGLELSKTPLNTSIADIMCMKVKGFGKNKKLNNTVATCAKKK
jgi:hypothetical protein